MIVQFEAVLRKFEKNHPKVDNHANIKTWMQIDIKSIHPLQCIV